MKTKREWRYTCKVCSAEVIAREYYGLEGGHYIESHQCTGLQQWMLSHPNEDFLRPQFPEM